MKTLRALLLSLSLAACGGNGGDTDGGGVDGSPPGMAELSVRVVDGDGAPIEGAMVAFDAPGGARTERMSLADGRALFTDIDWGLGTGALTVHATGFVLASRVDLDAANVAESLDTDGDIAMALRGVPGGTLFTISGTLTNDTGAMNPFNVSANVREAVGYSGDDPAFSVQVPGGVPVHLVGIEFRQNRVGPQEFTLDIFGMVRVDAGTITADATMDIDLSMSPTLRSVAGTMTAPGTGTPLAGGVVSAFVTTPESSFNELLGLITSAAPSMADPQTVEYEISWIEDASITDPITIFVLNDDPNVSRIIVAGYPTGGDLGPSFPPPPEIIVPAFGVMHSLYDSFTIGRVEPGLITQLTVYDLDDEDRVLWTITSAGGSEMITIPEPPSSVDRSAVFVIGHDIYARPSVCEPNDANDRCDRFALGGRAFDLVP